MALIERDGAMAVLAPYIATVPAVLRAAWARVQRGDALDRLDETRTTRAGRMRDYSVGALQRHWADRSDVHYMEIGQQGLFFIASQFAIRVKKFDVGSCSSNHISDQDTNFRFQGQIEGLPATYNLEIGYVLNPLETDIVDVRIACLNGQAPYWWESIERPAGGAYDLFQGQRDPNAPMPALTPVDTGVSVQPKKS